MMATETVTATVMVMEEAGLLNRSLLERVWVEERSEASQSRWPFTGKLFIISKCTRFF